ncbi:MAG: hypothetical protein V9F82_07665 [Dermatophilaceae bacterium]
MYEQGGFIPYFAGDSFTAIFPSTNNSGPTNPETIAIARRVMQTAQSTLSRVLSASAGRRGFHAVGTQHRHQNRAFRRRTWSGALWATNSKAYYFRGAPIDGCSQAQVRASSLEVVWTMLFSGLICCPWDHGQRKTLDDGYFKIDATCDGQSKPSTKIDAGSTNQRRNLPKPDPHIMAEFSAERSFLENQGIGEFRNVVSVFLSFTGVDTHDGARSFCLRGAGQECDNFGGYFKEIDFGDKGGVMFCLFRGADFV